MTFNRITVALLSGISLSACQPASDPASDTDGSTEVAPVFADVDTSRIAAAFETSREWLNYGGDYDSARHSGLAAINRETVGALAPAWTYDMVNNRGVEATPLVVDGVMYVTGPWSIVYAIDARTGEELWVHDPEVPGGAGFKACCDVVNRGVSVYEGKIFVGTLDGRLQALDAATGELLWSTNTVDQSKPYTITGAPLAAKGLVYIGNGGAEFGVRGYLSAYNIDDGSLAWRFYTAPNPDKQPDGAISDEVFEQFANDTWGDTGEWVSHGGGGTVWDAMVYDEVTDSVIFGVGNSSPWNSKLRDPESDGDNLFIASLVSVDAETGQYKWHFQQTPRDNWDFTSTQPIILADLPVGEDGEERRVAMQAPKNGFFYVVDAETGEFISGEAYAELDWAIGLDENGRPIENPAARDTDVGARVQPASSGAHNWHPMAYNSDTGLVYIPTKKTSVVYKDVPEELAASGARTSVGYDYTIGTSIEYPPGTFEAVRAGAEAHLTAWDPVSQELAWRVEADFDVNGGVLSTAGGLVFQGDGLGVFRAFDAVTGDVLWETDVKNGVFAAPMTYELDGEQYLTIAVGWGTASLLSRGFRLPEPVDKVPGRVITFKLNGEGSIPDYDVIPVVPEPKTENFGTPEQIETGFKRYREHCFSCHGSFAISSGVIPDLRWSQLSADPAAWKSVVSDGALTQNGMIGFSYVLSEEESEAVRAYVVDQAYMNVRHRSGE